MLPIQRYTLPSQQPLYCTVRLCHGPQSIPALLARYATVLSFQLGEKGPGSLTVQQRTCCKSALCQAGEGNWVPPCTWATREAWEKKKATPQHSLSSSFPCIKYLHGQGLMHLDSSFRPPASCSSISLVAGNFRFASHTVTRAPLAC